MAAVNYTIDGHIAIVTMDSDENRFNPPFLSAFLDTLNRIEADTEATTLVVKSAHPKIFSNGIDLEWLAPYIQNSSLEPVTAFFYQLNQLFIRLLSCPMATVAAINGHAFAGGAILTSAFDFRFMQTERGFFCLPEVDLGIPFLPGMNAMLKNTIPDYKLREMQLTGIRLTAEECERHHIVHKACAPDQLMDDVMAFAASTNKMRAVVKELKDRLYRDTIMTLEVKDRPYIEGGRYVYTD